MSKIAFFQIQFTPFGIAVGFNAKNNVADALVFQSGNRNTILCW